MNTAPSRFFCVAAGVLAVALSVPALAQTAAPRPTAANKTVPGQTTLLADPLPQNDKKNLTPVSLLDAESLLNWRPLKLPPYGPILIVGDEMARGDLIDFRTHFSVTLGALSKREIYNVGKEGSTTINQVSRLRDALEKKRPTVVIIATGRADRMRGLDLFQMQENITQMIQMSHQHGARVLILALPFSIANREDPHLAIARQKGFVDPSADKSSNTSKRDLTEDEKLRDRLLVDKLFVDVARDNGIAVDLYSISYATARTETTNPTTGLPNEIGHKIMAEYLWAAIKRYSMTDSEVQALTGDQATAVTIPR